MDKPVKLVFSDEATFSITQGVVLIPIITIISGFVLVLVTTDTTLAELGVPLFGMSGMIFIVVGIFGAVALGHRLFEKRSINRMFAGEIWECWQFSSSAWQRQVEAVCNLISPKEEGAEAYIGAFYSSIFGIVIAVIIIVITIFAIEEPDIKIAMRIVAGVIFLFLLGVGIFQPMVDKNKAGRYRQKALKNKEPRVWFGPDGIYHETLGHTSLKGLFKVTDQTKSGKRIQFNCKIVTDDSDDLIRIHSPVPAGCEERAGRLVLRYRQERLLA